MIYHTPLQQYTNIWHTLNSNNRINVFNSHQQRTVSNIAQTVNHVIWQLCPWWSNVCYAHGSGMIHLNESSELIETLPKYRRCNTTYTKHDCDSCWLAGPFEASTMTCVEFDRAHSSTHMLLTCDVCLQFRLSVRSANPYARQSDHRSMSIGPSQNGSIANSPVRIAHRRLLSVTSR